MKTKYILSIMVGLLLGLFYSCNKIPVGYLNTSKAVFIPDTIYVARNIDPESTRAKNNAPWTTLPIQGVAGTNPINYEYHSVKVDKGGDATKFEQMVRAGHVSTRGGMIQIFQEGVKEIPNGNYTISIRIYNEGHSHILKDAVTFIVQDVVEE